MNILITNAAEDKLSSLDIDIIKHITGTYNVNELVDMFSTFFYNKIVIDITDLDGVKYLIKNSNSYKDVAHIQKLESTGAKPVDTATSAIDMSSSVSDLPNLVTIGIKNATSHAGSTTLTYLLVKELSSIYGKDKVLGIEVDKDDFKYFNAKNLVSTSSNNLRQLITSASEVKIIIIDLNKSTDVSMCNKVVYLLEPSTLQLNRMIDRNKMVLDKLKNELVVLNRSLLSDKDVSDFESESGLRILYNLPPLNDRKRNDVIYDFLVKLNLVNNSNSGDKSSKIFGLFRR